MALLRSLLFTLLFYAGTLLWVFAALAARLAGRGPAMAVVLSWMDLHHFLAHYILGIRVHVDGKVPDGAYLIAVKHQSMFETIEMVRLSNMPIVVMKSELGRIPLFGPVTRGYGSISVERSAGASALRTMLAEAKKAVATGRPVVIYPEGTRVPVGETPPLRAGFAGLYRALGMAVVPVAVDSGRLWGRGLVKRSGTINFRVGEVIPAGLKRDEIERRVHRGINAFELTPQARA